MLARDELMLGFGFEAARERLANLTHGGWPPYPTATTLTGWPA